MDDDSKVLEALLRDISEGPDTEAWEASKILSNYESVAVATSLITIMKTASEKWRRQAATYAVSWFSPKKKFNFVLDALLDVLENEDEDVEVRGQAAEGVGHVLKKKMKSWRRAREVLPKCLKDPSPVVRFWTCFAVACSKMREALPILEEMKKHDHEFCPGWWYVSEEAHDAFESLHGREPADRECVRTFVKPCCPVTGKLRK